MPRMTSPMIIWGLRECRSAHHPKIGSEMSFAIDQAAMMIPSVAASMPCS